MPMSLPSVLSRKQLSWLVLLASACGPHSAPTHPEAANPVVELFVAGADGRPLAGASFGWFSKVEGRAEEARARCCTDDRGRFVLRASELPTAGETWAFAVAAAPGTEYALTPLPKVLPEQIKLSATQSLVWLRAHVVDQAGAGLEGMVKVSPAQGIVLSAFDQALLNVQPPHTSGNGRFEIRMQSSGPYDLQFATWDHADSSVQHVFYRDVTMQSGVEANGADQVIPVSETSVVSCTMVDGGGNQLAISRLGISMYPHGNSGHNDGCDFPGGEPDAMGARPLMSTSEVRFLWPTGAERVDVWARSVAAGGEPAFIGVTQLTNAQNPCRIEATTDNGRER